MKQKVGMIGRRFYRLVVLSAAEPYGNYPRWLCRCDCGIEKTIHEYALCRGATVSCGCYAREQARNRMSQGWAKILTKEFLLKSHVEQKLSHREIAKQVGCSPGCVDRYFKKYKIPYNSTLYDIVGKKFGRLKVISFSCTDKGSSYWNVKCDCGKEKVVQGKSLVRHKIVSCGCYNQGKEWEGVGDLSKSYWSKIANEAKKRKLEFSVSMEYTWDLFLRQNKRCALSGRELIMDKHYGSSKSKITKSPQNASLDRVDSQLGYVEGNVQWLHRTINRMKWDLDEKEFIQLCEEVALHSLL